MRIATIAGLILALPLGVHAQMAPYQAVIADAEVKLRAGPGDKVPETGTLSRGTKVIVYEEVDGWLGIQTAGMVSWVPQTFIDYDKSKSLPQNAVVQGEADVSLAPGQVGLAQPLAEVRRAKVPPGTILTVIGNPVKFDNRTWYPVEPPYGDLRYLPKTSVQAGAPVNTSFVVRDAAPAGLPTPVVSVSPGAASAAATRPDTPAPTKPTVNNPLWIQAEAAERDGRPDDADKLYFQLARLMNEPGGDHDVANLCYTRIHMLREKKRSALASTLPPAAQPASTSVVPSAVRPVSTGREDRATLLPPVRAETAKSPTVEQQPRFVSSGMLVKAAPIVDGRQTFALETAPGITTHYATAAPGVDVTPYINKKADIYGTVTNRKDLNKPFVMMSQIEFSQ